MARPASNELESVDPPVPQHPRSDVERVDAGPQPLNVVWMPPKRSFFGPVTFLLMVILPAIASAYYFFAVATDQYEAQARMVVRTIGISASEGEETGQVSMLSGGAVVQDAHILANYLRSPEMVRDLQTRIDLEGHFSDPSIDVISRLKLGATVEETHAFWRRQTASYVDGPSGIIGFSVRAFSKEDALLIAQASLESASHVVETLSQQAKEDLLERAQLELDKAFEDYVASLDALRAYQNETGILNPVADAEISLNLITELILKRLAAEAQVLELRAGGVDTSPAITKLNNEIGILSAQIEEQRKLMAGQQVDERELSEIFAKVIELETQRLLAENLYKSASRNFDLAKSNTQRQSTFVAVFSPPVEPMEPTYPERFPFWLIFVTACFALWATISLTRAAIEDHRN